MLLGVLALGCSSEDSKESYAFRNSTQFNVIVSPANNLLDGSPDFDFLVPAGQTKTYKSEHMYSVFDVSSNETDLNFAYKINGSTRDIYSFRKMVEYKITGNVPSANVTFATSNGGTSQGNVSLPHTIAYDYFANDFKYISAQSNHSASRIKVEIHYMDRLVASDECAGDFCIATSSH